ncbi:outer membrane receptor protein involved in Fe transport [Sphingobium jiangsuense]|uniref:Outer membrane receptor protein involved in Fe transport n=1 Tax=Sphingobium jiangsuense TaxID=870476 RepID=A0A7W6BEY9_9SPHN|nr:TonB-dependent receptor [Sphingobium jiangsuense]MBB3925623.1 outer membrane receptor protein involved in Fe transport [Sphingobium jiangsuense]
MNNIAYRRRLLSGSAFGFGAIMLGAALVTAGPAWAQDESAAPQDIVVTGSLIARPNNVSVSPIVSVSEEAIKAAGQVDLEATLNQLPGFVPSGGAATGGQGGGGRATVNLHGLGSNRNLVLLDGKRLPLSDINGNVDINILPESIIGGVDVITGGASAIYGSDAMSGVVNFKVLKPFEGIRADMQIGDSFRGDYRRFSGAVALGTSFAEDRGHLMLSASYSDRQPLSGDKRSVFDLRVPSSFIGQSTFVPSATNLPDQAVLNSLFAGYGVTSSINPTLTLGFNDNGSLFTQTGAINYQGPTTGGYAVIGNNVRMPVGPQLQILNGLQRTTLFGKADYELTDALTLYGQFLYVDSTVNTESGKSLTQFGTLTTIPVTNPFIPADLRTLLASRPDAAAPFTWNGRYVGVADKSWDENFSVQQYIAGLKGGLFGAWTFDVYAGYDKTVHDQKNYNAVLKSRVQQLLNAPDGGASLCAGGFNPFGLANASRLSPECQAYITKTAFSQEKLTQTQVQGTISGPLFSLPAGDMQLALLAGYRRNTYSYTPDSDLAAQNIEAVIASSAAAGRINVKEFAAQIDVPLLKDKPFIEEFGIGGAFRYSDYSVTGSVTSYEGDVRWRPVSSLLVRGSYQRAVRAPNIGELFSPATGVQIAIGTPPASIGDPCDVRSTARTGANAAQVRALCIAQGVPAAAIDSYQFPTTATAGVISGNTGLSPEKADTYNIGFIWNSRWTSPWLSNLSLSVDYYNIKIKDVISTVPGLTTLAKCYNLDGSNPTYAASNAFCALLARDDQGNLQTIGQPFLNLGGLQTDGVEIQVNWSVGLADIGVGNGSGAVYINSAIGYMNHYKVQTLPGTAFQDFAGTNTIGSPRPEWKALTTFGYRSDAFGVALRWRYQDAMDDISAVTTPANAAVGVDAYNLFDLTGNVKVADAFDLRWGITNLFDKGLPYVASSQNGADPGTFDAIGRSFYIGAKVSF